MTAQQARDYSGRFSHEWGVVGRIPKVAEVESCYTCDKLRLCELAGAADGTLFTLAELTATYPDIEWWDEV